jgi:hypothetical protein
VEDFVICIFRHGWGEYYVILDSKPRVSQKAAALRRIDPQTDETTEQAAKLEQKARELKTQAAKEQD